MENLNPPPQTPQKRKKPNDDDHNTTTDLPRRSTRFPRYYMITGTSEDKPMSKVSPMAGHLVLKGLIGTIEKIIRLRNGDLIVGVSRDGQIPNLLNLKTFHTAPVQVTPHRTLNTKKGVIRCPALRDIPEDEIVEGLSEEGVTEARKIYYNKEGRKISSPTVILTFDSSVLPKEIKAGYLNIKVDAYIPNPLRCFQCFRFGHHKDKCRRKPICAKCTSEQHSDDRQCTQKACCVNCSGEHTAFNKNCPKWLEEREIQRLKTTENISFSEARQRVRPTPAPGTSFASVLTKKKMVSAGTQWCAGDVMASDKILSSSRAPSPPSGKASTGIQTLTTSTTTASTTIPPKPKRQQQKSKEKTIVISAAKPSSIPTPKPAPAASGQGKKDTGRLPKAERRRLNRYGVLDPDAIDPSLEEDMAVDVPPSTSLTSPGKMQSTKEGPSPEKGPS
jgi:hypothetical protein